MIAHDLRAVSQRSLDTVEVTELLTEPLLFLGDRQRHILISAHTQYARLAVEHRGKCFRLAGGAVAFGEALVQG